MYLRMLLVLALGACSSPSTPPAPAPHFVRHSEEAASQWYCTDQSVPPPSNHPMTGVWFTGLGHALHITPDRIINHGLYALAPACSEPIAWSMGLRLEGDVLLITDRSRRSQPTTLAFRHTPLLPPASFFELEGKSGRWQQSGTYRFVRRSELRVEIRFENGHRIDSEIRYGGTCSDGQILLGLLTPNQEGVWLVDAETGQYIGPGCASRGHR